ncbi:hypothetical protein LXL04_035946 [Taraxacum kok-saghyz]
MILGIQLKDHLDSSNRIIHDLKGIAIFVDNMLYGRRTINVNDVRILYCQRNSNIEIPVIRRLLVHRGIIETKESHTKNLKVLPRSRQGSDHKRLPTTKKGFMVELSNNDSVLIVQDTYIEDDIGDALTASAYYHMTFNHDWFEPFKYLNGIMTLGYDWVANVKESVRCKSRYKMVWSENLIVGMFLFFGKPLFLLELWRKMGSNIVVKMTR